MGELAKVRLIMHVGNTGHQNGYCSLVTYLAIIAIIIIVDYLG